MATDREVVCLHGTWELANDKSRVCVCLEGWKTDFSQQNGLWGPLYYCNARENPVTHPPPGPPISHATRSLIILITIVVAMVVGVVAGIFLCYRFCVCRQRERREEGRAMHEPIAHASSAPLHPLPTEGGGSSAALKSTPDDGDVVPRGPNMLHAGNTPTVPHVLEMPLVRRRTNIDPTTSTTTPDEEPDAFVEVEPAAHTNSSGVVRGSERWTQASPDMSVEVDAPEGSSLGHSRLHPHMLPV